MSNKSHKGLKEALAHADKLIKRKRNLELLAYAKVCFEKCTSPFAHMHLLKMNVLADECIDLSHKIAGLIGDELDMEGTKKAEELLEQAEKMFQETQE